MLVSALQNQIATYLGRDTPSDFVLNGQDISLYALNSARRKAEQAHDFKFSEMNAYINIGASGANLSTASAGSTLTVSGTLTPNVTGTYVSYGVFAGLPLFALVGSPTYFIYYNIGIGTYVISSQLFPNNNPTPLWENGTPGSQIPTGIYLHSTGASGNATVAGNTTAVTIKRVKSTLLPLHSGEYEPIEFLTDDEYISRTRRQIGRQPFMASKSLVNLGVSFLGNPLCYQLGQTLYLSPSNLPLPIIAQILVVQFLPDYASGGDSDYFTNFGPEYLYWQGIIECNNFYKRFTDQRAEGQVDDDKVQALADKALANFIEWDRSTVRNTSTPNAQGMPQPVAPQTPQQIPQQAA